MKRIYTLVGLFMLFSYTSAAQFTVVSQKKIGGSGNDYIGFTYTHDSTGYYLIGNSDSNASFDKSENSRGGTDMWIVKTDLNFNIQWDKTIGGDQSESLFSSIITDTAIYCLLSTYSNLTGDMSVSNYGNSDFWLLKLDLNGNILLQKTFGGSGNEGYCRLLQKENHLLLVGNSDSPISGNKTIAPIGGDDLWLLEINPADFTVLSEKLIGSPFQDACMGVVQTNDNSWYIMSPTIQGVGGDKTDNGYGDQDFWIIKLDQNLNVLDNKCFGGSSAEPLGSLSTNGIDLYINGYSYSEASGNKTAPNRGSFDAFTRPDCWVVKLDSNLNILWDESYGGTNDESSGGITFLANDLIAIGSTSSSIMNSGNKTSPYFGGNDGWIIIADTSGAIKNQLSFGGSANDNLSVRYQRGDTLFCSGTTKSPISGNQTTGTYSLNKADFWAVTIKTTNLSVPNNTENEVSLSVFPNPFNEKVEFNFGSPLSSEETINLYSTDGKMVDKLVVHKGETSVSWKPTCQNGMYYYEINKNKGKVIFMK